MDDNLMRSLRDDEIASLKEIFVGQVLTDVTWRISEQGDHYTRLWFGFTYYEFLAHFTANDHQVAIAKAALERIELVAMVKDGDIAEKVREALEKMREAANGK